MDRGGGVGSRWGRCHWADGRAGRQGDPGSFPIHSADFSFHHLPDFISNIHQDPPRASYGGSHLQFRRQRQVDYFEFQDSLVYIVGSRPPRAPQRDPVSKKKINKQKTKKVFTQGWPRFGESPREGGHSHGYTQKLFLLSTYCVQSGCSCCGEAQDLKRS